MMRGAQEFFSYYLRGLALSKNGDKICSPIELERYIRGLAEFREWRQRVFERDKNRCLFCGKIKNLQAHHKLSIKDIIRLENIKTRIDVLCSEKLFDIDNGQTICFKCHTKDIHWL